METMKHPVPYLTKAALMVSETSELFLYMLQIGVDGHHGSSKKSPMALCQGMMAMVTLLQLQ